MPSPTDHQIYVFATSIMAAFFVASIIRLWLLRTEEERLLKNKDSLEKQVLRQQTELMAVRQDANAWRLEMQRQHDQFRHMASAQLGVEERRFNDLLAATTQKQEELRLQLEVARDAGRELPEAKARILYLERLLHESKLIVPCPPMPESKPRPASDSQTSKLTEAEENEATQTAKPVAVSPLPDLGTLGSYASASAADMPEEADVDRIRALQNQLAEIEKKNRSLLVALHTQRLRRRCKAGSLGRYKQSGQRSVQSGR